MIALRDCSKDERKHSVIGVAKTAEVLDRPDWKQTQKELRSTQRKLDDMTHVLTMGELTASIAHEINQPLAAIITAGEASLRLLAQPTPDAAKIQQLTRNMVADAWRASKIIDLIRATVSGRKPQVVCLSLENVVEESIAFLKHELQSRGISVSLDLEKELPHIVGDRTQLQQVIVNLAVNAVQAIAKSDGGSILVRTMLSGPETVCCIIEDSGPGVDSAHLPHLFDSFFTTKDAGMGMGLSISRSIIEAHGGQVRADNNSRLGGARFSFDLPANAAG
jgi:C4-dicarboxylate-specific signal transduction histidine kinase